MNKLAEPSPEPKRRKINRPPPRRIVPSSTAIKTTDATSSDLNAPRTTGVDYKIQQAKSFAVTQAQQDCCTGNFRIFDSPYGNFLVPVIPTRAELMQ